MTDLSKDMIAQLNAQFCINPIHAQLKAGVARRNVLSFI